MGNELETILNKSYDFLYELIPLSKALAGHESLGVSKSLLQSVVGITNHITEAIDVNTRQNPANKLKKAAADANETLYWLRRIEKNHLAEADYETYISHCRDILALTLYLAYPQPIT